MAEANTGTDEKEVIVVCGANTQVLQMAGSTVGDARRRLADVMNIPPSAQALITGNAVPDDYMLREGERLEFVRPAGVKG